MCKVHDNNILAPADLGIIITYQCQSGCRHCLYACGANWKDWMSLSDIELAFNIIKTHWQHHYKVHLTGGEPFLDFELLMEAVKLACKLDIEVYVETNAGWCTDEDTAKSKFQQLRAAGLHQILISCSPFHAERIPPIRTFIAIRAATQVFGQGNVFIYLPQWVNYVGAFDINRTTHIDQYIEKFGLRHASKLLWEGYGIISGGRASYRLSHLLIDRYPADKFASENCLYSLLYAHHSHFDLYNNFIPNFCGGLSLSNWKDWQKLLCNFKNSKLIEILLTRGPYGLFVLAKDIYGYRELEEGYTGKCHLCVDVRRWLHRIGEFQAELAPAQFYEEL